MNKIKLRKLVFKTLRNSGVPNLFRNLFQKNKVTILVFHNLTPEVAEITINYLSQKYNIISLKSYLDACTKKSLAQIPERALVITFDDGYKENYKLIPVFRKYNFKPTIFLCAGIINTKRHFWFEENHSEYPIKQLKRLSTDRRLDLQKNHGFEIEKEYLKRQALTKNEIIEMKDIVDFQCHTLFHPCLPKSSFEEAEKEIEDSKRILEKEYGLNINSFAYPNGDYSKREIQMLEKAGYTNALTVDFGFNTLSSDPFTLKRICPNDSEDINETIVKSSGLWDFFKSKVKNNN